MAALRKVPRIRLSDATDGNRSGPVGRNGKGCTRLLCAGLRYEQLPGPFELTARNLLRGAPRRRS